MKQTNLLTRSQKLVYEDLNFDEFKTNPLDDNTLRAIRYMHDIEDHTSCYLRDMLSTPSHRDPEITAFLAVWAYEEYFHGVALGEVLKAHGENPVLRTAELRKNLGFLESLRPALFSITSNLTNFFPALHMTWGALNELSTQAGYERLAHKANNHILTELLTRIMRQEGRHLAFYRKKAVELLSDNPKIQIRARFVLKRFWKPVGSSVKHESEVSFLADFLFGDPDGQKAAQRIDNQISFIPGLEGLNLFQKAINEHKTKLVA